VVLSFDVEEHHQIEAAAGLDLDPGLVARYGERVGPATRWILDRLAEVGSRATFFVVGQVARKDPALVRAIHDAGHEVASHGWSHRRVHAFTPRGFGEDLRLGKDALEQAIGAEVLGFRAPTFSIVRRTAWALDVLVERGFLYDSSIYPVRHDRYGVPHAPRSPFLAEGHRERILELPPATCRLLGLNVPVGGGGYFRLLPAPVMEAALRRASRECSGALMLYFHPWEIDAHQPRLPLPPLRGLRTYLGVRRGRDRLARLIARYPSTRAIDEARRLGPGLAALPRYAVHAPAARPRATTPGPA
jgi:polysaccharide deacetylase family protein (PEP-CTERM system associated)